MHISWSRFKKCIYKHIYEQLLQAESYRFILAIISLSSATVNTKCKGSFIFLIKVYKRGTEEIFPGDIFVLFFQPNSFPAPWFKKVITGEISIQVEYQRTTTMREKYGFYQQ